MTNTETRSPTPRDDDWKADFDPAYDENTEEGGIWHGLSDDEIVLRQIEGFNDDEHEEQHRKLDELAANKLED